jgi:Bacteriodetes cell division protein (FtsL-like)
MNKFKPKEEPTVTETKVKPKVKAKPNKALRFATGIINGAFLSKENALAQVPFIFFIVFLCMLYISNSYYAEGMVRDINKTSNELKELRSEYITTKSDLMHASKQSEVAVIAKAIGIDESTTPPYKINRVTDTTTHN